MTSVRQREVSATKAAPRKMAKAAAPRKTGGRYNEKPVDPSQLVEPGKDELNGGDVKIVSIRLQPDELADLLLVMKARELGTLSDGIRESVRIQAHQIRAEAAGQEIAEFYGGREAPLPEGVVPITPEELAQLEAEADQW